MHIHYCSNKLFGSEYCCVSWSSLTRMLCSCANFLTTSAVSFPTETKNVCIKIICNCFGIWYWSNYFRWFIRCISSDSFPNSPIIILTNLHNLIINKQASFIIRLISIFFFLKIVQSMWHYIRLAFINKLSLILICFFISGVM